MMKNKFILSLFIISSFFSCTNDDPPNIIVIISDDQGYADVGFHGSEEIFTPNIDRIAENGVVFHKGTYPLQYVLQVEQV